HAAVAEKLGAHPGLHRVISLSACLLQRAQAGLPVPIGTPVSWLIEALGISGDDADVLTQQVLGDAEESRTWHAPAAYPLLIDLLRMALEQKRNCAAGRLQRSERECELLYQTITDQRASEQERLQEMKLKGLAELAAGAGHEINNPLAVISGQAQYLLRQLKQEQLTGASEDAPPLPEPLRTNLQKSYQTIIGQTQRIHQVLT